MVWNEPELPGWAYLCGGLLSSAVQIFAEVGSTVNFHWLSPEWAVTCAQNGEPFF